MRMAERPREKERFPPGAPGHLSPDLDLGQDALAHVPRDERDGDEEHSRHIVTDHGLSLRNALLDRGINTGCSFQNFHLLQ